MRRWNSIPVEPLSSTKLGLFLILLLAGIIRSYYAAEFPLSGDEVGVGIIQATGHAMDYQKRLPEGNFPIREAQKFIDYEEHHGLQEVFNSLTYGGMHPPFYYIVSHYIIKFMGNNAFLLRMVSVVFSIMSVYVIYLLGEKIYDKKTGLYAAFFLSISPYCLRYSVMVRPYPLLMLLSLLSTLQVYSIVEKHYFSLRNINFLLYLLISIIGIYTMYHYVFIIIFQFLFVVLSERKNMKAISHAALGYLLVLVTYIPWLPSLAAQLKVVNEKTFYFHDTFKQFNLISFVNNTIQLNFIRDPYQIFPQIFNTILPLSITVVVLVIFLFGSVKSFINDKSRLLLISLACYFIITVAGDKIMHANTISWEKFQFFLIPILFLIFSYGMSVLPRQLFIRYLSFGIISFLLIISAYSTGKAKVSFGGPYTMKYFREIISAAVDSQNDHKVLIILNTNQRRYLFSLVHELNESLDITILQNKKHITSLLKKINRIKDYNEIFICDFLVDRNKNTRFAGREVGSITSYLFNNNFSVVKQLIDHPSGALVSFAPR